MIKISNVLIANATQAPRANVPKIANKNNRLTTLNKSQLIIEWFFFNAHKANIIGKKNSRA